MISSTVFQIIYSAFAVYGFVIAIYEIKLICFRLAKRKNKKSKDK